MFCDESGRPNYPGKVVREKTFEVFNDTALPSWLVAAGVSQVLTFSDVNTQRGYCRTQTKVSSPTSGDTAGVQTAFNIKTSEFEEISFIAYSVLTDTSDASTHSLVMSMNNGSTAGFYLLSDNNTGNNTKLRLYPAAQSDITFPIAQDGNAVRRKDIGVTIRPRTKEVFITAGDPYEGAGVIAYNKGGWVDVSGVALSLSVIARTAAQRYLEFSKIKLRLVSL